MSEESTMFISCGIFREEIEYLIKENKLDRNLIFLDASLHVNFDKLKKKLTEALEENSGKRQRLKVLYGNCHPEMQQIMKSYSAKRIGAANCLEAMIGAEEMKRLDSEAKAFYLSAGWVNNWEEMFALGEKDFGLDFKSMFGSYKRIVVLDTGVIPVNEEKVRKFSELTGLPVVRKHITLDYFLNLIKDL